VGIKHDSPDQQTEQQSQPLLCHSQEDKGCGKPKPHIPTPRSPTLDNFTSPKPEIPALIYGKSSQAKHPKMKISLTGFQSSISVTITGLLFKLKVLQSLNWSK
jgi:hypothetical protein